MPRLLQRQRLFRRLLIIATLIAIGLAAVVGWQRITLASNEKLDQRRLALLEESRRAANLGNRAREQAEDLAAFMLDDLREQLIPLGRTDVLGDAAERTLEYFENLPPELVTPTTVEARASIIATLASVNQDRGDLAQAEELWNQAIGLRKQLSEAEPDSQSRLLDLVETYNSSAISLLGSGKHADARNANLAALSTLDKLAKPVANASASTLFGLGECERANDNPEGALNYYDSAISALGKPDKDDVEALQVLMTCYNNIGICHSLFEDHEASEKAYLLALPPARRLLQLQPEDRHWQREIATLLNNLGCIYDEREELEKARPYFLEALQLRKSLITWDPANSAWQLHYANSLRNLASLELSADTPEAAVEPIRRSLRVRLELLAREPDNQVWLHELQDEARRFAERFHEQNRPEFARELSDEVRRQAEEISRSAVDSVTWNQFLSKIYNDLGNSSQGPNEDPIAIRLRSTALRAANVAERPDDSEAVYQLAAGYLDLADDLIETERKNEALHCLRLSRFLLETRLAERYYRRESLIDICLRLESEIDPNPDTIQVVGSGSIWKYYDSRNSPGEEWYLPDFDDSAWKEGPAQLGYGDGDEDTLLSYGQDPDHKNLAAWFRHGFDLSEVSSLGTIRISLLCDDGARVLLNGEEIIRHGLPDGPISPTTTSNLTVSGQDEEIHHIFIFEPDQLPLRRGKNLIAAEVHQNEARSSDLSFALEFAGPAPISPPREGLDLDLVRTVLDGALPEVVEAWLGTESAEKP